LEKEFELLPPNVFWGAAAAVTPPPNMVLPLLLLEKENPVAADDTGAVAPKPVGFPKRPPVF
jgi:hypothetical protein